jgi:phage shock protein A
VAAMTDKNLVDTAYILRTDEKIEELKADSRYFYNNINELSENYRKFQWAIDEAKATSSKAFAAAELLSGKGAADGSPAGIERRLKELEEKFENMRARRNAVLWLVGFLFFASVAQKFGK